MTVITVWGILSVFIGITSILLCYKSYFTNIVRQTGSTKPRIKLLVGVLSARNHFELRSVQRRTLLSRIESNRDVAIKFIVGKTACLIHPEDRLDAYSCVSWNPGNRIPREVHVVHGVFDPKKRAPDSRDDVLLHGMAPHPALEITFGAIHPVVITEVGILHDCLLGGGLTTVELYIESSDEVIASATFNGDTLPERGEDYVFKPLLNVVLPGKQVFVIRVADRDRNKCNFRRFRELSLDRNSQHDIRVVSNLNALPGVSFKYGIHDAGNLEKHILGRSARRGDWKKKLEEERVMLLEESRGHGDVLLVDTMDVYRNLPEKTLQFFAWAESNLNYDYILKTDDDCYIDIEAVLRILEKSQRKRELWWGNFHRNWAVEHHGKWVEMDYDALVYPPFACGSGYVLSNDVTKWLARNKDVLRRYQGEDTSMGIWLAALRTNLVEDGRWNCFRDCSNGSLSIPDLTSDELLSIWYNTTNCGHPCECSFK